MLFLNIINTLRAEICGVPPRHETNGQQRFISIIFTNFPSLHSHSFHEMIVSFAKSIECTLQNDCDIPTKGHHQPKPFVINSWQVGVYTLVSYAQFLNKVILGYFE